MKDKNILIGTSAGINSAAVLIDTIQKIKSGVLPRSLHLVYIHINQHSPDSEPFVNALVAYAKHHFPETVYFKYHYDILDFFEEQKMIPHPKANVCSRIIKTENIEKYKEQHEIDIDLIGYVKQEKQRIKGLVSKITGEDKNKIDADYYIEHGVKRGNETIIFPIAKWTDEECFDIVEKAIGWYPSIYNIFWNDERVIPFLESVRGIMPEDARKIALKYAERGHGFSGSKRIFNHNNCLPCKNMQVWQFWLIKLFFPKYFDEAVEASKRIGAFYGRSEMDYEAVKIYTSFGREDYEVGFEEQSCGICKVG